MNIHPRLPILPLKLLVLGTRVLLWLIVLSWVVLVAAWGILHFLIVPRIGELRPEFEARASQALGLSVRIGSVVAHERGLFPTFELGDVRLVTAEGRTTLQLPRVQATLSARSLWNLGFEQLHIERPELDVHRDREGRIFVAGIEVTQQSGEDGTAAADWLLSQTEWVISRGAIAWRDDLRDAPPLELRQVELRMRNGLRRHEIRLDATPPPDMGSRFSLRGRFRQPWLSSHPGIWQRWSGQLYAMFERVDLVRLKPYVPQPLALNEGQGGVRAWVDVEQGRLAAAEADVVLAELGLPLGPDVPKLELARLSGRLGGKLRQNGFEVYTQNLKFKTKDGLSWTGGDIRFGLAGMDDLTTARGELRGDRVDLETLGLLSRRLPLERRAHEWLAAYAPKGQIEALQLRWAGPWKEPQRFSANGRVLGLEIAAQARTDDGPQKTSEAETVGSPGVRGLNVDFDLTQDGGRAGVAIQHGHLDFPGVFEQPRVPVDQLTAELQWKSQKGRISVQLNQARFANDDAQGELQLKWQSGEAHLGAAPGELDLQGSLSRADLAAVHRYLPKAIPADVRHYLRDALTQGRGVGTRFRVRGDLRNFPFNRPDQGEFRISSSVQGVRFDYVPRSLLKADAPGWPVLTDLQGEFQIENAALDLKQVSARAEGAPQLRLIQSQARLPSLVHEPRVLADLQLTGPLNELLQEAVVKTPVNTWLDGWLGQARANGSADTQLRLDLPLQRLEQSKVQGRVRLSGNELQYAPQWPRLQRMRGIVHFSEQGFALAAMQARLLGGDIRAEGGTIAMPDRSQVGPPRLRIEGAVTAQGLRDEQDAGLLMRLGQRASGAARYTAEFGTVNGAPEFEFKTSMQGLALDLPSPLYKTESEKLPIHARLAPLQGEAAPGAKLDLLRLQLGTVVDARYVRERGRPATKVRQGAIAIGLPAGETVPLPETGVVANVNFETLDLDAWRGALLGPEQEPGADNGESEIDSSRDYLPTHLIMMGRQLAVGGQQFNQLVAAGTREGDVWRANLDAREFSGYAEYRMPSGNASGSVYARLARLVLAQEGARGVENLLNEQPVSIPALDVVINDFELKGKRLGQVEIEAVNRGQASRDGGVREWRLSRLTISMPGGEFNAYGNWAVFQEVSEPGPRASPKAVAQALAPRPQRRRTVMNFQLDIKDAGGVLERLNMPGLIRSGQGRMEGQVSWLGSPMSLDYPSLGGQFNINVESGQFLKAEPGIAKLLGVLSLQSLPRRLALDFRDVFTEGFSFDFVRGDVRIDQGVVMTNNLQMKGVNAAVLMEGHTDLARETQELRVVVVPEINAGTASLIAGWINPAVGLTTFLAQVFLRGSVIAAATQEFRISGNWTNPKMEKVDRASAEPAPAASAPSEPAP